MIHGIDQPKPRPRPQPPAEGQQIGSPVCAIPLACHSVIALKTFENHFAMTIVCHAAILTCVTYLVETSPLKVDNNYVDVELYRVAYNWAMSLLFRTRGLSVRCPFRM